MVWHDILAEAIAVSGDSSSLSAPTSLLKLSENLENPLTALSGLDTGQEIFGAFDEDFGFIRVIRSLGSVISVEQKEKLASLIRWLIATLCGWRQIIDPKRATLTVIIVAAARLDENGALWGLMPDKINQNHELGFELQDILGRLQFRIGPGGFSRSPIVDGEQMEEFAAAEAEQNWSALRYFAENISWRFYSSAILDQSVRGLNRFFPDQLIQKGRAVSQVGVAMQMMTAISVVDSFRVATQAENNVLQFAAVCRLFSSHDRLRVFDDAEEDALVSLLRKVSTDAPRWTAWMQAFATHPYQTSLMQPAIGQCLALSDDTALRAYIEAILLQSNWLGRNEVKTCLGAFANCVSLERRQVAWRMAFARWSDWNFGERDDHSALTEISVSNIDFAIVGYAVECLTSEEREVQIAGCLKMVERVEHSWHESHLNFMYSMYRVLSHSQPLVHARDCGTHRESWLWNKSYKFLFDQFNDPYWRLRYNLHDLSDG